MHWKFLLEHLIIIRMELAGIFAILIPILIVILCKMAPPMPKNNDDFLLK